MYCLPTYFDKHAILKLEMGEYSIEFPTTIFGEYEILVSPKFTKSPFKDLVKIQILISAY